MKALSALAQSVRASTTMAIDTQFKKMRAEGIDVIGFSVGEPDFPTPEHIKQAGIRAIENDQTKYTPTPGTLALRQAVRKRLQEDWGLDYTTEEIVVSGGGKPILYVALKTLLNPGDEVILPAPYWVSYYELIKMPGHHPQDQGPHPQQSLQPHRYDLQPGAPGGHCPGVRGGRPLCHRR